MKSCFRNYTYAILAIVGLLFNLPGLLLAQIPQDLPKPSDNEPIDLSSPFSIIFFIVIPLVAIIAYIFLKRRQNRK